MPGSFVDSNVLLYLLSSDERKRSISKRLLDSEVTISVQVLNEIVNVARRKQGRDWAEIGDFVDDLLPLIAVIPLTIEIHRSGREIASRYSFAFYDSLIIAAAIEASCTTLFSEDLHHSQKIGELTIVNPFALSGDAPP